MKARKVLGVLLLVGMVSAGGYTVLKPKQPPQILLTNATAAPLDTGEKQLAVFVSIENSGPPDTLLFASAPDAKSTEFSETFGPLALPSSSTPALAADGVFVKLHGVNGPLDDGRTLPISLTFATAGTLTTRARIVAPRNQGEAATYGLFGIGDICQVGDGEPAPHIELEATKIETGWKIDILSDDFEFTPELVDGPHVPGTGHGHLYVNGLKLGRLYAASTSIGHLPFGQHEIRVTLSTNDHRAYVVSDIPVTASIRIRSD
ncbi:copper chaperone PCu(A)C [uncultured Shimia sp.]|uniref:copper chaperone PCu(A)C n=1 Tax=uncultured Shimia sp. TaxID=573152 RepID=UPI0025FB2816|nr:copper chaperone PCu(A)C [uncultured Shimia sp.]